MSLVEYILPFELLNKKIYDNKIPNDIIKHIYSFILENLKETITNNYILKKINNHFDPKLKRNYYNEMFVFHYNEIPYFKNDIFNPIINNKKVCIKNNIKKYINKISKVFYNFSHSCCDGKGLVFKPNNLILNNHNL
jgi:hypothetical protein